MINTRGFTLIEVIIVVAIITSTLVVGVSGYNTQVRNSALKSDASIVVDDLERTKQRVLSREVSNGICVSLLGYPVTFQVNGNVYTITRTCSTTSLEVLRQELKSTVIHSGTTPSIFFSAPYAQVASDSQVIIRHPGSRECIRIFVPMIGPVSSSEPYSC